jgi:putative oxidoreductase
MNILLSPNPVFQNIILFIIRVTIAIFLIIHGKEVFETDKMNEYIKWENFKTTSYMPYLGKGAEFFAGLFLLFGLFTRLTSLIIIGTFLYITFFIGNGKFWMEDQHPFLYVLFGLLFLFCGPGRFALDNLFFRKKIK